jgi:hypothetical protein
VIQERSIIAPPSTATPMRATKQTTTTTSPKAVRLFSAPSRVGTSRIPRVAKSHTRSLCMLSTVARIRYVGCPPAILDAMLWPGGTYRANRGRRGNQEISRTGLSQVQASCPAHGAGSEAFRRERRKPNTQGNESPLSYPSIARGLVPDPESGVESFGANPDRVGLPRDVERRPPSVVAVLRQLQVPALALHPDCDRAEARPLSSQRWRSRSSGAPEVFDHRPDSEKRGDLIRCASSPSTQPCRLRRSGRASNG